MNKRWSNSQKPVKPSTSDKEKLYSKVDQFIKESSRLSSVVNRIEIKAGRIYLYCLHEQFGWDNPNAIFIKPLIEGKYVELPMARITLFDILGEKCEVDWQRHTGQWLNLFIGSITECLDFIERNEQRFG